MSEVITKPGCYRISNEVYHQDPCCEASLSRGTIMHLLNETPAHAFIDHPRLNPDYKPENNSKYDIGSAAHSLFLEGKDKAVIVDADDWRTKAAKETRDAAWSEGKIPLLTKDSGKVNAMILAAKQALSESELGIKDLQKEGISERSYFWQENGIWCRVRPDWLKHDRSIILDYKTSSVSANPNVVSRAMANMGYAVQAEFYKRGVKAVDGVEPTFIFLFQETTAPYLCSLIGLSPAWQELGKQQVNTGIMLWKECIESGNWPGYTEKICYPDLPPWIKDGWEMRRMDIESGLQEDTDYEL